LATPHDHEPPVGVLAQVLADDGRQQRRCLHDGVIEIAALKRRQQRVASLARASISASRAAGFS
jgi:hypothetical protein